MGDDARKGDREAPAAAETRKAHVEGLSPEDPDRRGGGWPRPCTTAAAAVVAVARGGETGNCRSEMERCGEVPKRGEGEADGEYGAERGGEADMLRSSATVACFFQKKKKKIISQVCHHSNSKK